MALARAYAVGLVGLDGHLVEVEADLAQGLPGLTVIGLPDAALGEARDRVRAAVVNSGQAWPQRRITLALSPASLPKRGSGFDLALAASVLAAAGVVPADALLGRVLIGELGLDGRVRPVRGVLPAVLTAARAGIDRVVVPLDNLAEAALLPGAEARGVGCLRDLVALLTGEAYIEPEPEPLPVQSPGPALDLVDALEKAGIVTERASYCAQPADMFGMRPSRVMATAVRMGDKRDPPRSSVGYRTGLRRRCVSSNVDPLLTPTKASEESSWRISKPCSFTMKSLPSTPSGKNASSAAAFTDPTSCHDATTTRTVRQSSALCTLI